MSVYDKSVTHGDNLLITELEKDFMVDQLFTDVSYRRHPRHGQQRWIMDGYWLQAARECEERSIALIVNSGELLLVRGKRARSRGRR